MPYPLVGGANESRVTELIESYGVWEIEDSFTSFDQQDAAEDVLTPLDFGNAKVSPNGLIEYDNANKYFRVLKSGCYFTKTRARAARIGGSAGESELFLQSQFSIDNGVNWVNTGNSVDVKLDDSRQVEVFFDFSPVYFPAGILVRQIFARSSLGTNFGSLIPGIPSVPLQNLGLSSSPAAQVSVYRLRDFNYT